MSALPPKSPATVAPFSDALGYRVLGFDKKSGDRLEMLRLRPQLASAPAFESAVRERQRRLAEFRHLAFARVRQIDRPQGQAAALAIVSNYADGQRLSDVLRAAEAARIPIDVITAACLLRQAVAAMARLHEIAPDVSHGTLNPERLVVTSAGRIVITEYVVGAGLAALPVTPQQAWQDYRVALPVAGGGMFDQAADVYQLGYLGLTLVRGRSLYDRQFPPPFATLLASAEEATADGRRQPLHSGIAGWLARALGSEGDPFPSAVEAQTALDEAIASAGLVATPDVIVELLARLHAEPEPAAPAHAPAPAAPALQESPAAAPPARPSAATSGEHPSAWTPPAEPERELPPFPRRDNSAPHRAAIADHAHEAKVDQTEAQNAETQALPALAQASFEAPHQAAAALPVHPPVEETPDLPLVEPQVAEVDAPAPHAEQASVAAPDELPPSRAWTPKAEPERPVATRAGGTLFGRNAEPVAAAASPSVAVRRPYFVALGMAVVMVAVFEIVMRMFNPFMGTPAKAISASELSGTHGTLAIDAVPQARVFIDEAPKGTTPIRLDLVPGVHRVRLEADGHGRAFQVNVIAGKEISQLVELSRGGQVGTIDVKSDPPGARVLIDGKAVGVSPVSVTDLKPGTHSVVLEGPGGNIRQVVQVSAGATSSILVPLSAASAAPATTTGWVGIDSPEELQVFVGGRLLGTSRTARLPLDAGTHDLELRSEAAGFSATRSVQVTAGKVARVSVQMPDSSLSVNALPWAEVWLDGARVGETPIANVTVRAGTHELVFRHPNHGEIRQTVVVKAGDVGRVTVNMAK